MFKTFSVEEKLPKLLVPSLETTIEKYLYSVKAIATDSEYKKTARVCKQFLKNESEVLQKKLKERELVHHNWVEELWTNIGYLDFRFPLLYLNFIGCGSYHEQFWPMQRGTQVERAAFDMYNVFQYWMMLRNETMEPHKNSKGEFFSMQQMRTMFSTCRIPRHKRDDLELHFKTKSEGNCPTHIIVLYRGYVYKIEMVNPATGKSYTQPQIAVTLSKLMERSDKLGDAPGVPALTSLDRETWAHIRSHIMSLSKRNGQILDDIQSAVIVMSLDDAEPKDFGEMLFEAAAGDPTRRWRDKSFNPIWSRNGVFYASADHTTIDGMVVVLFIQFVIVTMEATDGKWTGPTDLDVLCPFEELKFDIDQIVLDGIEQGKNVAKKFRKDITIICPVYEGVGKTELKQNKVYPDAFVQICLQLTYMRMHGKPAPTYETATTRRNTIAKPHVKSFYHGRTETCRTCIPELVQFCRALITGQSPKTLQSMLRVAHDKLVWLMRECQANRGCDRHLLGLSLAAAEKGGPTPEIFTDPMYTKTGGNGNFILSTSFVGFLHCSGCATPMLDDGYGVFYRINDHRIVVTIATWNYSTVTDAYKFKSHLEQAISDVYGIFCSTIKSSQL